MLTFVQGLVVNSEYQMPIEFYYSISIAVNLFIKNKLITRLTIIYKLFC